jgi:hypothetical protein
MKGWFARVGQLLAPADEESARLVSKLGDGEGLRLSVTKVRSLDWHNMYFGCCRAIGLNCDPVRDEHSIDYELRIRAGHYDVMFVDGVEVRLPKRIAFDKLTSHEWAALWLSLDLAMQEHFHFDFDSWKRSGRRAA